MTAEKNYNRTVTACFVGYVVQAIVNNFVPLLFLTFQRSYAIPLSRITLLVTINFGVQLLVDLASVTFVDRIGYRASMLLAHAFSAAGLVLLTVLPEALPSPFAGILASVILYAIGGGLLEVLVSPVMEACPSDNKEKAMSMLHSFYCWGHVGVVLLSTVYFKLFGIGHWKVLALLWSVVPVCNLFAFVRAPIAPLIQEGERGLRVRELFGIKAFWVLLLMMICAGASEQAVSQWASTFAEKGLGISKAAGDLAGPMAFAALMPSLAHAVQKGGGYLFPFGWWHLVKAMYLKREEAVELMLIAVDPEYRNRGVHAMLFNELFPALIKDGFKYGESNAEMETNNKVQNLWNDYKKEFKRRRRVFSKSI